MKILVCLCICLFGISGLREYTEMTYCYVATEKIISQNGFMHTKCNALPTVIETL